MKKIYSLFFLVFVLFISLQSKANEITVKGHIKFANGSPAKSVIVNFLVTTASNTAPCTAVTTTDIDGFYTKLVGCTGDIKKVQISVKNCDSTLLTETQEVPLSKIVEQNFTLCSPPPVTCVANFEFGPTTPATTSGFTFKFNSNNSTTGSGDKIIGRTWKFGDGEELGGNVVDPTHTYKAIGTYNVCLTIKSDKGCSNTKCATIEIKAACKANFTFEPTATGLKFNSNTSTSLPNDPITKRTWNFGDGTPEVHDVVDPTHLFSKAGTYTVCLTTRTAGGCESKECKQIVVPPVPVVVPCAARYSFEQLTAKKYRFNSSISTVANNDSIIERHWDFHDGAQSSEVSPIHEFSKAGTYEVCLTIKTKKGCESRFCLNVKVEEVVGNDNGLIKIVSLYPTPVHGELNTLVYSKNNNVTGTISIVDVYGNTKWSKQVVFVQGNNPFSIPTSTLLAGPYFLHVTTLYGTLSKPFYKL